MKFLFSLITLLVLSFFSIANAAVLNQIFYNVNEKNDYVVTFIFTGDVDYQLLSFKDEIQLDLFATKYDVTKLTNKLDKNYIKKISKRNIGDDIRITFTQAPDVNIKSDVSFAQNGYSFLVIQFSGKNDDNALENVNSEREFVIVVDPGHGGGDQGTVSSNLHILEKDLTLEYALALKKELSKYPQYKVFLTRESDVFLSPEKRLQEARKHRADIFISIHADYNNDSRLRGASIYTLPQEAITQETKALLELKNKNTLLKNDELLKEYEEIAGVLINMLYQDTQNSSIKLAKLTSESLSKEVNMLKKAHRALELKVLKGIDIPAILIELGYLSNQEEEKQLSSLYHRKLFTHALAEGINQYFIK